MLHRTSREELKADRVSPKGTYAMTKVLVLLATATIALTSTAAVAQTSVPVTMKHDGVAYTYTVEEK
jgi:hypothetical protein